MKVLILSGGKGSRLWPYSSSKLPKQFLTFGTDETLLEATLKRFLRITERENIFLISGGDHEELSKKEMRKVDESFDQQLILEPKGRGTAPAVCFALSYMIETKQISYNEPLLICPSDLFLGDPQELKDFFKQAKEMLKRSEMICFGVEPTEPSSAYGYIVKGSDADTVSHFVEKPNKELARSLIDNGAYWNSGIFMCTPKIFYEKLKEHSPSLYSFTLSSHDELKSNYGSIEAISIDHAIMERSKSSLTLSLPTAWSDLGSWDSIYKSLDKDENGNVSLAPSITIDTRNCLIFGKDRCISTIGLEDMLIIDHDNILLILKRGLSEKVKSACEKYQLKSIEREDDESIRPWGYYAVLEEGPGYKIKRIHVDPKQKLSVQMHHHREEHWVVINGEATVTKGDKEFTLGVGEHAHICKEEVHALENANDSNLEIIEVQIGSYLGEDDIIRFSDRYGRTEASLG